MEVLQTCGMLIIQYDFKDALLVEIAKKYKAVIVTDDGDFSNYIQEIPIVTGNEKLLNWAKMMSWQIKISIAASGFSIINQTFTQIFLGVNNSSLNINPCK